MKDKARGIREPATIALLRIGGAAVPALLGVLQEAAKEPELRVLAVVALGAIGKDAAAAVPALASAVKDVNPEVRLYAARALGRIGSAARPALKALEAARKDDDPNVRSAAAEAIKQIEGPSDG
ncbi:MAG: HEAT repeat domain-containing protein [Gemmataceae bacterium]